MVRLAEAMGVPTVVASLPRRTRLGVVGWWRSLLTLRLSAPSEQGANSSALQMNESLANALVPLPVFSYGGSFMLASWLTVGILLRISSEGRGRADALVL